MQGGATIEQINCGSLQRIADATEKMALWHTELIAERNRFESSMKYWNSECNIRDKKLSAAKGQITKLKKKMAEINAAFEAAKGAT